MVLFFCTLTIMPCLAESSDIRIPMQTLLTANTYVCVDDNLVATYVSGFSPPAIKVYDADGTLHKSIPLTNDTMDLESLGISDDRVFYTEYDTSELWASRTKIVYEFDMATEEKRIIYTASFINNVEPRITKIVSDGKHAILCEECGGYDLILIDLSSGNHQVIFTSRDMIHALAIDGDRIMWGCERADREPGREIHVYTISTSEDYIIPESKSIGTWGYGDISGDLVVWSKTAEEPDISLGYPSLTTAGGDIRLTDLTTGNTISLEILNAPSFPYISGDTVVYVKKPKTDYNNADTGTIRIYDIETGEFSDVASEVAGISDFDKGLILWHRYTPRSYWISSVSGTILTHTQSGTQIPGAIPQNPSAQESPVGPITIVSALITGIAGYALLKKNR